MFRNNVLLSLRGIREGVTRRGMNEVSINDRVDYSVNLFVMTLCCLWGFQIEQSIHYYSKNTAPMCLFHFDLKSSVAASFFALMYWVILAPISSA